MKRKNPAKNVPRSYGRQAKGRTIKTLTIDAGVAEQVSAAAKTRGANFSAAVEGLLRQLFPIVIAGLAVASAVRSHSVPLDSRKRFFKLCVDTIQVLD